MIPLNPISLLHAFLLLLLFAITSCSDDTDANLTSNRLCSSEKGEQFESKTLLSGLDWSKKKLSNAKEDEADVLIKVIHSYKNSHQGARFYFKMCDREPYDDSLYNVSSRMSLFKGDYLFLTIPYQRIDKYGFTLFFRGGNPYVKEYFQDFDKQNLQAPLKWATTQDYINAEYNVKMFISCTITDKGKSNNLYFETVSEK